MCFLREVEKAHPDQKNGAPPGQRGCRWCLSCRGSKSCASQLKQGFLSHQGPACVCVCVRARGGLPEGALQLELSE